MKIKNAKQIGLVVMILGLILTFAPYILPASILGAILPVGTTGGGALGVKWTVGNALVTENKPLSLNFGFLAADGRETQSWVRLYLNGTNTVLATCKAQFYCGANYGFPCYGGSGIVVPYSPRPCGVPLESFQGLNGKTIVRVMANNCNVNQENCSVLDTPCCIIGTDCPSGRVMCDAQGGVGIGGWQYVNDFEVWIDGEGCQLQENNMVVAETFAAGRVLTLQDLRFPVKGFCATLPILVTEAGQIVEQRIEDYSLLQRGTITIPENQTWTFFYVADISPDVAVVCQDGVFSAEENKCIVSPAIVFSCSGDAIFDPVQKVCVSQPETRVVCEFQDAVYDTQLQRCVKIIPIGQTEVVCPANSVAELENGVIKRCVFATAAAEQWVCEAGQLDTSVNPPVCNKNAETEFTTVDLLMQKTIGKSGFVTLIGIALIIIGGFLFVKEKR